MPVGDVKSDAKGSGARYNDGKTPWDYMPVYLWRDYHSAHQIWDHETGHIIAALSEWQRGALDARHVLRAVPHTWMEEAMRVFDYGAHKYAAWNWAKGMAWSIPVGCILRHFEAIFAGEMTDAESGCLHHGHIACNIIMLAHFEVYYKAGDDRPPASVFYNDEVPAGPCSNYENVANEYDEAWAARMGQGYDSELER